MEIISLSEFSLDTAVRHLQNKSLVAFPSDTVYGLLGILDKDVALKLHNIRERSIHKPFLIILPAKANLNDFIDSPLSHLQKKIVNSKWPGRNTFIFNKSKKLSYPLGSTIALRKPSKYDNILFYNLVQKINYPLLAPSLNLPGEKPLDTIQGIEAIFNKTVPYLYWDNSFIPKTEPSKIFNLTKIPFKQQR